MSVITKTGVDTDGTLLYECGPDVLVKVKLHQRNGSKKCPVDLLYQGNSIASTDANLRELRDIETLNKHASNRCVAVTTWHDILMDVSQALPAQSTAPWEAVVKALADYPVERKEYLWYPVMPKGEPMSLEGDPGTGKSALLVKLMCHLTTGTRFPTLFPDHPQQDFTPRTVVLFTYEDDPRSTLHPRMLINGGDPTRVQIIEGKRDPETGNVIPMSLQDLSLLEDLLRLYTPALIAFDPMQSFLGPHVDMNQAAGTRPILDGMGILCKQHACTPLFIRHNGKAERSKAIHNALGSIDITAAMRSVLALYRDPDVESRRIVAHTKANGRYGPSMQLKFTSATYDVDMLTGITETVEDVRVDWDGMSDLTAADLNAREVAHGNNTEEAQTALDHAREFLREVLTNGPVLVEEIYADAKKAGVSQATLRRAKTKEKIRARREDPSVLKSPWIWEWLPAGVHI